MNFVEHSFRAARVLLCAAGVLASPLTLGAQEQPPAFETSASQAIIVDGETGSVLFEKDADTPFPPASLAKLMTMEVVFEALAAGRVTLADTYLVSEHAWRTGGAPSGTSTMFAAVRSKVPLDALIRGTIIQAANDATIIIAEGMAGTEAAFAVLMNETAAKLGLKNSVFVNPTGLPAEGQKVTVRDLVLLARHMEGAHKDFYPIYAEPAFEWNKIFQRNRNPLLAMGIGATGMASGFAEGSGYALVGVTDVGGRRTFLAIGGLKSSEERTEEARKLLVWADASFRRQVLFDAATTVGQAVVYGGVVSEIPLRTKEPVVVYMPKERPERVSAHVLYDGPLRAPVAEGVKVGRLEIRIDGKTSLQHDLFAAESVEMGTFAVRALDAARELAFGWIRSL